MSVSKKFTKYVISSVLGMLALSCYILADTFFVSNIIGINGLAALNISISIYSVITAIGLMLGIGGGTKYSLLQSQGKRDEANKVFTLSILTGIVLSLLMVIIGVFFSSHLATLLGADEATLPYATSYLTTILCFSPLFITNGILVCFLRNDKLPKVAMFVMIVGSFSNIVLDYCFMAIFNWGMFGAAFATALAPLISIICMLPIFISRKQSFALTRLKIKWTNLSEIATLGLSSFVTEIASAVVLIFFNLKVMQLAGNVGVAAYGIVANIALVFTSIFVGISQALQPQVSSYIGQGDVKSAKKVLKLALIVVGVIGVFVYVSSNLFSDNIIAIFNNSANVELNQIAKQGILLYFTGFLLAGFNIVVGAYFSAKQNARLGFVISLLRGLVVLLLCASILSTLFGIIGLWLSFVVTELIVLLFVVVRPLITSRRV